MTPAPDPSTAPLAGLVVVDLSRYLPGPFATAILAQLGATVFRIESNADPDPMRILSPAADGLSHWFRALHVQKKLVSLDLRAEPDRNRLRSALKKTDILVEGFRPGVMKRLGLDPGELCREFPQLISCSISGYGQTGALATHGGHDLNYMAMAGALDARLPKPVQHFWGDLVGGSLQAVIGILAALHRRHRNGRGQWLDVSIARGLFSTIVLHHISMETGRDDALHSGYGRGLEDLLDGRWASYNVYCDAEGQSWAVAALEPHFWAEFCRACNHLDWKDRQLESPPDALLHEVRAYLGNMPTADLQRISEHPQSCVSRVLSPGAALAFWSDGSLGADASTWTSEQIAAAARFLGYPDAQEPSVAKSCYDVGADQTEFLSWMA